MLGILLKLRVEGIQSSLVKTIPVVFQFRQVDVVVNGLWLEIGQKMRLKYLVLVLCDL